MPTRSQMPPPSTTTKIVFFSLMGGLTFLTILLTGEIFARFFFERNPLPDPPPISSINPYRPNPYFLNIRPFIYTHIPGSKYLQELSTYTNKYTINSMGFRGPEISPFPPKGMKRLLILGDSLVEGHGVAFNQTFSYLLGNNLGKMDWEVINLGVQGASPVYFASNLERYRYLNPDAVLFIIHENDLFDDEKREQYYFDLPVTEERTRLITGKKNHSLLAKSSLFALLETARQKLFQSPVEKIIARNAQQPSVFSGQKKQKNVSGTVVPAEKFDLRWSMSAEYIDYALKEFEKIGTTVLISPLCSTSLAFADIQENADHCANLQKHVEDWAAENGVPYYPLANTVSSAFANYDFWEVLIFKDFHPTPLTHGLLAADLYPFLVKQLTEKK